MKRNIFMLITMILLFVCQTRVSAQYVLVEADKQFEQYNYDKAIVLYEQAYKKKATLHAAMRLAASYKFQNNYLQTENWYAIAAKMEKSPMVNVLEYAKALQVNSKFSEAKLQFQKYADLNKNLNPELKNIWLQSCDSAVFWLKEPRAVTLTNEKKLNSPQSDWAAVVQNGTITFASDRAVNNQGQTKQQTPFLKFDGIKKPDKMIYGWTGNQYLKLYQKNEEDSIRLLPMDAQTPYHVGPAYFTADGKELYFALTKIYDDMKFVRSKILGTKQATVNVEIYSAVKDTMTGKWGQIKPFMYNNVNEYSVGDPFVAADGRRLFFSSDMPGGKGGSDLYFCEKTEKGEWGIPVNIAAINTEGNERCPALDADHNFYFSSDGRVGMGGLDIYTAKLTGEKFSEPKNLGYPVNSPQDDFSYTPVSNTVAYLASNRMGGVGDDDIYSVSISKPQPPQVLVFKLVGVAYNNVTKRPLENVTITLDKVEGASLKLETDRTGKFSFDLDKEADYKLTGIKIYYKNAAAELTTKKLTASAEIVRDLYLQPLEKNKPFKIDNLYYDFDKSNIREDAEIELDKLVKFMYDNPSIWIELSSHTDSRGNDKYNQVLSQKRADAAVQYLVAHGIKKFRITAKGYGASRLLNKCSKRVQCTEAEHQLNRRTEVTILKN